MSQLKVKVANSLKSLLARLSRQQESERKEATKPAEQDQNNPRMYCVTHYSKRVHLTQNLNCAVRVIISTGGSLLPIFHVNYCFLHDEPQMRIVYTHP